MHYATDIDIIKEIKGVNTEGRGFESHLGLRFFLCPLMVDSLHLPLFPLYCALSEAIMKLTEEGITQMIKSMKSD